MADISNFKPNSSERNRERLEELLKNNSNIQAPESATEETAEPITKKIVENAEDNTDIFDELEFVYIGNYSFNNQQIIETFGDNKTDNDKIVSLMKRVFQNKYMFTRINGLPKVPTKDSDKKLLINLLQNYFNNFRVKLLKERKNSGNSIQFREKLEHLQKIRILVDHFEDSKEKFPYHLFQTYIDNEDMYNFNGDLVEQLSKERKKKGENERIRRLLRQFAKLYLTQKNSDEFVLTDPGMSKEKFAEFRRKFKSKIPQSLERLITLLEDKIKAEEISPNYDALYKLLNELSEEFDTIVEKPKELETPQSNEFATSGGAFPVSKEKPIESTESFIQFLFEEYKKLKKDKELAIENAEEKNKRKQLYKKKLKEKLQELKENKNEYDKLYKKYDSKFEEYENLFNKYNDLIKNYNTLQEKYKDVEEKEKLYKNVYPKYESVSEGYDELSNEYYALLKKYKDLQKKVSSEVPSSQEAEQPTNIPETQQSEQPTNIPETQQSEQPTNIPQTPISKQEKIKSAKQEGEYKRLERKEYKQPNTPSLNGLFGNNTNQFETDGEELKESKVQQPPDTILNINNEEVKVGDFVRKIDENGGIIGDPDIKYTISKIINNNSVKLDDDSILPRREVMKFREIEAQYTNFSENQSNNLPDTIPESDINKIFEAFKILNIQSGTSITKELIKKQWRTLLRKSATNSEKVKLLNEAYDTLNNLPEDYLNYYNQFQYGGKDNQYGGSTDPLYKHSIQIANDSLDNFLIETPVPFFELIESFDKNIIRETNELYLLMRFVIHQLETHFNDDSMSEFFTQFNLQFSDNDFEELSTFMFVTNEICNTIKKSDVDVVRLEDKQYNSICDELEQKLKQSSFDFYDTASKNLPEVKTIDITYHDEHIFFKPNTNSFEKTYTIDSKLSLYEDYYEFNEEAYMLNNKLCYFFFILSVYNVLKPHLKEFNIVKTLLKHTRTTKRNLKKSAKKLIAEKLDGSRN